MEMIDISSGEVKFGPLCPGTVMQWLRLEQLRSVRRLKRIQTAFSAASGTWSCQVGCGDPTIVAKFIKAPRSLEELSILNYHLDIDILWPSVFKHANSLKRLEIHTQPQEVPGGDRVWTVESVKHVASELPNLRHLALDITVDAAKAALNGGITAGSILDEVAKMESLESLRVSIILLDADSPFAGESTPRGSDGVDTKPPACAKLARMLFQRFLTHDSDAALQEVELRLTRRVWYDRGQFSTAKCSFHAVREKKEPKKKKKKKVGEKKPVKASGKGKGKEKGKGKAAPEGNPGSAKGKRPTIKVTPDGGWMGYSPECSPSACQVLEQLCQETYQREYGAQNWGW